MLQKLETVLEDSKNYRFEECVIDSLMRTVRLFNKTEYSSHWDCMLDSIIRIEEKYFHCEDCVFKDVFLCPHRREAKKVLI